MDSHRDYDYSNNEMDRSFEDYSDVWNESTAATVQLTIRIFIWKSKEPTSCNIYIVIPAVILTIFNGDGSLMVLSFSVNHFIRINYKPNNLVFISN